MWWTNFVIRYVCQDIGGSDPERMAAPRVEEYIQELFSGSTSVSVSISWCGSLALIFSFYFSCLLKSYPSDSDTVFGCWFLILYIRWQLLKILLSLKQSIHCMKLSTGVQEVSVGHLVFEIRTSASNHWMIVILQVFIVCLWDVWFS